MSYQIRIDGHIPPGPDQAAGESALARRIQQALDGAASARGSFEGETIRAAFTGTSMQVSPRLAEPAVHKRGAPEHPLTGDE